MLQHVSAYHYWLVILAVIVCGGASLTTFTIYSHLLARGGTRNRAWLLVAGLCSGAGAWATDFIAMLAYDFGVPARYNPFLILASFAVGLAVTTLGLQMSLRRGREMVAMGGATIGLGIAVMHFLGMSALIVPGDFLWNWGLILLAASLGVVFMVGALLAYRELKGWRALLSGAGLFAAGICSLHFTGMAALTIIPDAQSSVPAPMVEGWVLAIAVAGVTALVLLASYLVAMVDARAMRETFSGMGELIDVVFEGLVVADDGVIVNVNARILELSGCTADELIGQKIIGTLLTDARRGSRLTSGNRSETRLLRNDGASIPVEVARRRLNALAQGNEIYAIRDLRERDEAAEQLTQINQELRQREQELRMRNLILNDVLSQMSYGLCMYDQHQRVVICNESYATLYGLPADVIQPGMSLKEVVQKRIDNGIYTGTSSRAYMEERTAPVIKAEDTVHELNNGQIISVARRILPGGGWMTTHKDITARRRMEAQIAQMAHHDVLTDLPSRKSLRDKLVESLAAATRHDRRIAVLMLGIDRFNEINDALGHAAGDNLLQLVAKRLQDSARRSTLLGRFSDDKFIVAEVIEQAGRDADALVNRIQEELHKPFTLDDMNLDITATMGVALFPGDGTDADTLLKYAALALHRAKIDNRGSHRFFKPAMHRELRARRELEQDLKKALERREFELHYQPLVDLGRGEITGFEAFLRWQHPVRGLVSPGAFLPLAEEIGLINPIEEWTLLQACKQAMQWPKTFTLAVNFSVTRFRSPDLVGSIGRTLASTGLAADRLQIEITEKVLHENAAEALKILRQLFELGVRVVLDDFGAGFSSLTYLRQFPFHKIKIDRSFVNGLTEGEDSRVIIRTLARLGTGLRIATAAEGVETKEQYDIVRAEGCTEMQGHYFSPPKTAEEIGRLLMMRPAGKTDAVA